MSSIIYLAMELINPTHTCKLYIHLKLPIKERRKKVSQETNNKTNLINLFQLITLNLIFYSYIYF